MNSIVIITQNQCQELEQTIVALQKQRFGKVIVVLDRCKDNSENICKTYNVKYVKTPWWWIGRKTSSARNLGLKHCNPNSNVLFLDGDRAPVSGSLEWLNDSRLDAQLLLIEKDSRDLDIPFEENYGKVNNNFFSCGLYVKRSAINKVIKFQGEFFPTKVEKQWGCEDLYLGDIFYHLGLTAGYYTKCNLKGIFERTSLNSFRTLKKRFILRDKLNIRW